MRRPSVHWIAAFCGLAVFTTSGQRGSAQQPPAAAQSDAITPRAEIYPKLDDAFLRWPLPPGDERYGAIDGKRMHNDVVEQTRISRRYRDAGHPKFWGRITGTSSDAESARWLAAKFTAAGLSDVRIQPLDLEPQWMPQTWEAVIAGGGKTVRIESAQPFYGANALPAAASTWKRCTRASEARRISPAGTWRAKRCSSSTRRDCGTKGRSAAPMPKAPVSCSKSTCCPATCATRRIRRHERTGIHGRERRRVCGARSIAAMPAGQTARVKASFDMQRVPNLKSALVWGTLPGATDETIYLIAHRDGWFDAAGDNAGGVASIVGLAEYYAKVPRSERQSHHRVRWPRWASQLRPRCGRRPAMDVGPPPRQLFAKTALMINAEHPSTIQTTVRRATTRRMTTRSCGATPTCRSSGMRAGRRGASSRPLR